MSDENRSRREWYQCGYDDGLREALDRIEDARAEGYRAGIEAAAKVALSVGDRQRRFSVGEEIAAAIRDLVTDEHGGKR